MAKTEIIALRVDAELKKQAQELFEYFGMSTSWAITAFLTQCVREQAIPLRFMKNISRMTVTEEELKQLTEDYQTATLEEIIDDGEPEEHIILDVVKTKPAKNQKDKSRE